MLKLSLIVISLFIISCGEDDYVPPEVVAVNKIQSQENLKKFYGSQMKDLHVKVFYEPGAEPSAGMNNRGEYTWGLLEQNIQEVFVKRSQNITLHVPKKLEDMSLLNDQEKSTWSANEIFEFSKKLGVPDSSAESSYFTFIYLKGSFDNGSPRSGTVLGVSLAGTTVIAIFKDAINQLGPSPDSLTVKFGEQATLVHEMGHALGIVANGVNAVEDHHDKDHGSHCSNSKCVMYWMNEGNKDLLEFIQNKVTEGNVTLYGSQCLDDIKAYSP